MLDASLSLAKRMHVLVQSFFGQIDGANILPLSSVLVKSSQGA